MPGRSTTWARVMAVSAATTLLLLVRLGLAPGASAHDVLVSTTPASGATLTRAPARVVLTFDQPALALGTEVQVTGPGGRLVSVGRPRLVNSTVAQALGGLLPAGEYAVAWRVTSADGHPVSGRFGFASSTATTVQEVAAARSPARKRAAERRSDPTGSGLDLRRLLPAVCLLLLVLAVVVLVMVRRSGTSPPSAGPDP